MQVAIVVSKSEHFNISDMAHALETLGYGKATIDQNYTDDDYPFVGSILYLTDNDRYTITFVPEGFMASSSGRDMTEGTLTYKDMYELLADVHLMEMAIAQMNGVSSYNAFNPAGVANNLYTAYGNDYAAAIERMHQEYAPISNVNEPEIVSA